MLNSVGLGVLAFAWVWTYIDLLDALAVSRLWLLVPFGLVLSGAIVYVVVLGRKLARPMSETTVATKPEPTLPNRRTLTEDLREELRYGEQAECRSEDDIRRLESPNSRLPNRRPMARRGGWRPRH